MSNKKLTGYPSIDKPQKKYYKKSAKKGGRNHKKSDKTLKTR